MSDLNRRNFLAAAAVAVCACATCGLGEALAADGGTVDIGPLSSFNKDGVSEQWARSASILVVRNENKLYACTAICSHKRAVLKVKGGEIACDKHGSRFSNYGTVTKGPAKESLTRYGISVNDKGNVIVDKSKTFREKEWENPGAFLDVK